MDDEYISMFNYYLRLTLLGLIVFINQTIEYLVRNNP